MLGKMLLVVRLMELIIFILVVKSKSSPNYINKESLQPGHQLRSRAHLHLAVRPREITLLGSIDKVVFILSTTAFIVAKVGEALLLCHLTILFNSRKRINEC